MSNADFLFWGLAGILSGTFIASIFQFSALATALILFFTLAIFGYCFILHRAPRLVVTTIFIAGLAVGIIRTNQFLEAHGSEIPRDNTPRILLGIKTRFEGALYHALPEPESSFAAGLILGRSPNFPQDLMEMLKRTNTLHLVAVSGYNITVIAQNAMKILETMRLPMFLSWWGAVISIVIFTLLVGAPASAVRAAIMGTLMLIGRRLGRQSPMRLALAFAAAAMVLHRPSVLRFDLGFQLSFLATIGMVWLSPLLKNIFRKFIPWRGLTDIAADTLGAQTLVAPWLLYKFGTISFLGVLANLIILPVVPLAMLMSFIAGATGLISGVLAALVSPATAMLLGGMLAAARYTGNLPFAFFKVESVPLFIVIGSYAIIFTSMILGWRILNDIKYESKS